jgi:iron complex transport system substrate-binding protein
MRYYFVLFLLMALGCQNPPINTSVPVSGNSSKPRYAKGFDIVHQENTTQLVLFDLQKPGDTLEVITLNPTPSSNLACLSTTHLSYFDLLGSLDVIKSVAFADLVSNPHGKERISSGKIMNLSGADDVNMELLLSHKPEYFFVYPYGHGNYDKYTSKGIVCIPISEYLEPHPLGRLEWIKVFGAVIGKQHAADSIFNAIAAEYEMTRKHIAEQKTTNPTAFTGSAEAGTWFAPPGNSFQSALIQDAGATYIYQDTIMTGNLSIPLENLVVDVLYTDFWGIVEFSSDSLSYSAVAERNPLLKSILAFQQKHIFYCNTSVVDYFGDAVVEPHIMLKDLGAIFHPQLFDNHTPKYFQPLH